MKTLYTTIIAILWVLTASAQTPVTFISENFNGPTYKVTYGADWGISNTAPVSPASGGNYLTVTNGNGVTSTFTMQVNATDYQGVVVTWYERRAGTGTNKVLTRSFSYSVGTSAATTLVTTGTAVSDSWTKFTATLESNADFAGNVLLTWTTTSDAGNVKYTIDDIAVSGTDPRSLSTMPVELASFQGQAQQGASKLAWTTASEKNNDKFVVERSLDGKSFKQIGEVKGNGNSSTKLTYSYTDKTPVNGTNYYRLRQVDTDGTEAFSNIVALEVAVKAIEAAVYPTVASQTVTINLNNSTESSAISVVDATGRTIATFTNTQLVELPVSNLKSGVYFVHVTDGQSQQVQRFIKQ